MHDIIQFQLVDAVVDVNVSKIIHNNYDIKMGILEIIFENAEPLVMKISYEQFQLFDAARNKLVIIEDFEPIDE